MKPPDHIIFIETLILIYILLKKLMVRQFIPLYDERFLPRLPSRGTPNVSATRNAPSGWPIAA